MLINDISAFLDYQFYGNPTRHWLIALAIVLIGVTLVAIGKVVLIRKFSATAQHTETEVDDLLVDLGKKMNIFFYGMVLLHSATESLILSAAVQRRLKFVVLAAVVIQMIIWINTIVKFFENQFIKRHSNGSRTSITTVKAFGFGVRILFFLVLLLITLQNLNIQITTLITGLGIGGIAIALAVQNILGDLFAALSITIDKPFLIGDSIAVDTFQGTVEHIGLKTTRIRSLTGEQIIFSNGDLLKSRIRNYRRMYERRIAFTTSLTYDTDRSLLEQVPIVMKDIIEAQAKVSFNRSHLTQVSGSSLDFETVYHVTTADYDAYMDIQQAINLAVLRKFDELKIHLATSSQTIQIQQTIQSSTPGTPIIGD